MWSHRVRLVVIVLGHNVHFSKTSPYPTFPFPKRMISANNHKGNAEITLFTVLTSWQYILKCIAFLLASHSYQWYLGTIKQYMSFCNHYAPFGCWYWEGRYYIGLNVNIEVYWYWYWMSIFSVWMCWIFEPRQDIEFECQMLFGCYKSSFFEKLIIVLLYSCQKVKPPHIMVQTSTRQTNLRLVQGGVV